MVELKASNAKSGESVHLGWYDNYKKAANAIIEEVRFGEADEPAGAGLPVDFNYIRACHGGTDFRQVEHNLHTIIQRQVMNLLIGASKSLRTLIRMNLILILKTM